MALLPRLSLIYLLLTINQKVKFGWILCRMGHVMWQNTDSLANILGACSSGDYSAWIMLLCQTYAMLLAEGVWCHEPCATPYTVAWGAHPLICNFVLKGHRPPQPRLVFVFSMYIQLLIILTWNRLKKVSPKHFENMFIYGTLSTNLCGLPKLCLLLACK